MLIRRLQVRYIFMLIRRLQYCSLATFGQCSCEARTLFVTTYIEQRKYKECALSSQLSNQESSFLTLSHRELLAGNWLTWEIPGKI
ncbi:hypothetical protein PoB_002672200 [Plakobranchus ocellatus]|uniref:Secreted protein n=1 Tax=Plakobranchus ocellatus TaxID=259542 RepID=A0AAV3ZYU9_9GAST|nr:hypothetical protein PoB_002672200 [Plakobranchus ocellatus]